MIFKGVWKLHCEERTKVLGNLSMGGAIVENDDFMWLLFLIYDSLFQLILSFCMMSIVILTVTFCLFPGDSVKITVR